MSYGLFWIELLVALLLWFVAATALLARVGRKFLAGSLLVLAWLAPLWALAALTAMTAGLKFAMHVRESWFGYTLGLSLGYVIGTIVILIVARRRTAPGLARASRSWPPAKLLLAFLVAMMLASMTLWNMDLEVRAEAATARTEAGALLLAVVPPDLPDDQNAAVLYEKAFERLKADSALKYPECPLEQDAPDPKSLAVAELLARHALTLALLREGASRPVCRFDHNYARPSISMLLPELNWCRLAALLLALDARHELSAGRVAAAVTDVQAMFRLGQGVAQEPLIISALVGFGIDHLAVHALAEVLPAVTDQAQLAPLRLLDPASLRRSVRRSLQGEEAFGLATFCDIASGQLTLDQVTGRASAGFENGPESSILLRVFLMPQDFAAYRRLMESYQEAAAKPYDPGAAQAASSAASEGLLTSILLPAFSRFLEQSNIAVSVYAEAQAAVALTRYRLEHGEFPRSLNALVPKHLDDVPVDPFDGKTLRFVVKPDKCLIYSVGPDGKDDGGSPYDEKAQTGDIVFSLPLH